MDKIKLQLGILDMAGKTFSSVFVLSFALSCSASWSTPIQAAEVPQNVKNAFALFALKPEFRHRFESMEIQETAGRKILQMNLWYEDASVTKSGEPTEGLFCRIAHILTFGRHRERSQSKNLPLDLAFSSIDNLEEVRLTFFGVFYTNKPIPPDWAQKPIATAKEGANPNAKLRVIWSREEKIIPYLSYSIQKGEWKSLSSLLRNSSNKNFVDFQNTLCPNVLKVAPGLRANFKEVQTYIAQSRAGATEQ